MLDEMIEMDFGLWAYQRCGGKIMWQHNTTEVEYTNKQVGGTKRLHISPTFWKGRIIK